MQIQRVWAWGAVVVGLLGAVACSPGEGKEPDGSARGTGAASVEATQPAPEVPRESWAVVEARAKARADSVDRALRQVQALSRSERSSLRRDVNRIQTARARALGVRPEAEAQIESLVRAGRLVRLPDTTRLWVVRDLEHSVAYVTPDTEAMLTELGERFQARLDSLGLPRFRLVVNSVLRTPEKQSALRRLNSNAASGVSAHEFGTTLDVAYRRFGAPLEFAAEADPAAQQLQDSLLVETATLRGAELQAVLGRVLAEMKKEGKVLVMMERRQTVYHMTVARRYPKAEPTPAL